MTKGPHTRDVVLREALAQASSVGLKGITIGGLAESLDMSKSGLFAHFKSKEQLQVDVLEYAADLIVRTVLQPALKEPRGEARLRMLLERWMGWDGRADYALPGGCIFLTAASEYDDEPDGPVREVVIRQRRLWLESLVRVLEGMVTEGEIRPGTDLVDLAHDLNGITLDHHASERLMHDPEAAARAWRSIDRLLDSIRPDQPDRLGRGARTTG